MANDADFPAYPVGDNPRAHRVCIQQPQTLKIRRLPPDQADKFVQSFGWIRIEDPMTKVAPEDRPATSSGSVT